MKKLSVILLSGVALVLAGCGNQGGSTDEYNSESGTTWKTNSDQRSVTNDYQGSALSPGGSDAGFINSTNYPGQGTNDQGLTFDPERTNSFPQN